MTCLSDGLHFYLALFIAALLGVGVEAYSPPICIVLCTSQFSSAHWCVYFYRVSDPTPWIFGKINAGSTLFLRVFLLIVLSDVFETWSEVLWGTWLRFFRDLVLGFRINIPGGIHPCCWVYYSSNRTFPEALACFVEEEPFSWHSNIFLSVEGYCYWFPFLSYLLWDGEK